MESHEIIVCVLGSLFGIGTIVSLAISCVFRTSLVREENNKNPLISYYPRAVRFGNNEFACSGPFSRMSVYSDFVVIRIMGMTRVFKVSDFTKKPYMAKNWIVFPILWNKRSTEIFVYKPSDDVVLQKICEWISRNDGVS